MTLSEKLKKLRKEKKLTRKAAAEQSGMSIATYSAYEDGKRIPKRNPENYEKLAAVFGCTPEYLRDDSAGEDTQNESSKPAKTRASRKQREAPAATAPIRMELQFGEQAVSLDAIAEKARAVDAGITELYIKPEENAVYYVAGETSGSFELF